mmetsp:Transcript_47089/g.134367  ORF Transcript_47089/g.134367 Transcript_47089/m.134367 type:complete len:217 (+) Transcript_47089:88-738(+)
MMWTPESVDTTWESSPSLRAKEASENAFCIFSRAKRPRSPPLLAEPQSECSVASSRNLRGSSSGPSFASWALSPRSTSAASSAVHVIFGSRQDAGRLEPRCFRIMWSTWTCAGSSVLALLAGPGPSAAAGLVSPQFLISTRLAHEPPLLPHASIFFTTSMPAITFPKTTCFPLRCGVFSVQMKNWEPFECGPELAMERMPGPVCFFWKFSSRNFSP